jgi:hypothetical protein
MKTLCSWYATTLLKHQRLDNGDDGTGNRVLTVILDDDGGDEDRVVDAYVNSTFRATDEAQESNIKNKTIVVPVVTHPSPSVPTWTETVSVAFSVDDDDDDKKGEDAMFRVHRDAKRKVIRVGYDMAANLLSMENVPLLRNSWTGADNPWPAIPPSNNLCWFNAATSFLLSFPTVRKELLLHNRPGPLGPQVMFEASGAGFFKFLQAACLNYFGQSEALRAPRPFTWHMLELMNAQYLAVKDLLKTKRAAPLSFLIDVYASTNGNLSAASSSPTPQGDAISVIMATVAHVMIEKTKTSTSDFRLFELGTIDVDDVTRDSQADFVVNTVLQEVRKLRQEGKHADVFKNYEVQFKDQAVAVRIRDLYNHAMSRRNVRLYEKFEGPQLDLSDFDPEAKIYHERKEKWTVEALIHEFLQTHARFSHTAIKEHFVFESPDMKRDPSGVKTYMLSHEPYAGPEEFRLQMFEQVYLEAINADDFLIHFSKHPLSCRLFDFGTVPFRLVFGDKKYANDRYVITAVLIGTGKTGGNNRKSVGHWYTLVRMHDTEGFVEMNDLLGSSEMDGTFVMQPQRLKDNLESVNSDYIYDICVSKLK